ncbi:class I SAM-dependent methyltransferase [Candidatus Peregrinibacteria bacterium]|nr:class I SAM-dependent methyltransferase [Candidatus Peregrinibacteria bacterium]
MYLSPVQFWLAIEVLIFVLIFVPTMIAFFTGAPWVPTPIKRVRRMMELAKIKQGERVYDLGCGDGRMAYIAAKDYNADAVGIELSPIIYAVARIYNFFRRSKAKILLRDFRRIDFSNADVLTFYLLPPILKRMREKWERELKPGARIVSYAFEVEGWEPVYVEPKDPQNNFARILVYEIPKSIKEKGSEEKK